MLSLLRPAQIKPVAVPNGTGVQPWDPQHLGAIAPLAAHGRDADSTSRSSSARITPKSFLIPEKQIPAPQHSPLPGILTMFQVFLQPPLPSTRIILPPVQPSAPSAAQSATSSPKLPISGGACAGKLFKEVLTFLTCCFFNG